MKITVLGAAGGIGQALSLLLKNSLPAQSELALYDVAPFTPGVATDLSHIPTDVVTKGYGKDGIKEALSGADIVLISAGVARKPGMTRADLFNINAGIIKQLMEDCARFSPDAIIGIITNPVNTTVAIAKKVLVDAGVYKKERLFGITTLDVIRSERFISELKGTDVYATKVPVIGGHSGTTILPLLSQVDGVDFTQAELEALTNRIQNAGTEVVEAKAGAGSATLSMGYAAARFAFAVIDAMNGDKRVICSYVDNPDAPADFFAQPVKLGRNGIESILSYGKLSDYEQSLLDAMLPTLKEDIQKGYDFK